MHRVMIICLIVFVATGCAPRNTFSLVEGPQQSGETLRQVFVASNRTANPEGLLAEAQSRFGAERDATLRYGRADISIPPAHEIGQIEWPGKGKPDPAKHFVLRGGDLFDTDQNAFLRQIKAQSAQGDRRVLLYVHGYNSNLAEAIYRVAQVGHDYEADMPIVAFAWASAGDPRGYVYDRDSMMFSRDGLETLLMSLDRAGRKVVLVGHSMGTQLVMETLRQMSIGGRGAALSRLEAVILVNPDIDEDVFRQQAKRIEPFPKNTVLLVSGRDRALNLSAFLTGKPSRLGSISDNEALSDLPVEVIDLTDFAQDGDFLGHFTHASSPGAIAFLRALEG